MVNIRMTELQHKQIKSHLFPGDSLEAVAIASCGRFRHEGTEYFMVNNILLVPHERCIREIDHVQWPTEVVEEMLENASEKGHAIVKFHSHPGFYREFSALDDKSDNVFFDAVYGWCNDERPHASMVMLPDGDMFGRSIDFRLQFKPLNRISIIGNDLKYIGKGFRSPNDRTSVRDIQAFGEGTISTLANLRIAVIGCSGTGSAVLEQLYRLNVGILSTADHDQMEFKNLNRVYGSKKSDAKDGVKKVHMMKFHLDKIALDVEVKVFDKNIFDSPETIKEVICSDLIFGCVDKVDAKQLLNHISTYYLCPYIDVGVKFKSDGKGGVEEISGSINYVHPEGPSLLSRNAYSMRMLEADSLHRIDPEMYQARRKEGYMVDVDVSRPAVISVNTTVASLGVNEMLARISNFRYAGNEGFDTTMISLTEWDLFHTSEGEKDKLLQKHVGSGDAKPLLGMLELNKYIDEFF